MNALEEIFSGKKRIVICGIGNDIRGGDDAFGVLVAERLKGGLVKNQDVLIINCGEVPENYTSKIAGFEPDLVVFVDAVDFKGEVGGEFIIADPEGDSRRGGLDPRSSAQVRDPVHEEFHKSGLRPYRLSARFDGSF